MVIRSIIVLALVGVGVFIGAGMLHESGLIGSLFSDKADELRASAELRRVDVEMLKALHDHEERQVLIEAATQPRTPGFIVFLMLVMAGLCGALFVKAMKEREKRRFSEYKMKLIAANHRESLPEPKYTMIDTGKKFYDARDQERGGAPC